MSVAGDALHPGVDVQDRADVGMVLVDHPVLDRVDRHAARLDVRRHAEDHPRVARVVARHEQDVAVGLVELRLVDAARAHPEAVVVLARGEVAVGQAADRRRAATRAGARARRAAPRSGTAPAAARARRADARLADLARQLVAVPRARARGRCGTRSRSRVATWRAAAVARRRARRSDAPSPFSSTV